MSTIKANRWAVIVSALVLSGAGLVLAFMLVFATQNRERYESHFGWLLWTNLAIAALLVLVILGALVRLMLRIRQRKFGSFLLLKMAGMFAVVSLVPGLLVYGVSYQFVSRSIETWFDVRVEGALEAGLNLGRSTLDNLNREFAAKTQQAADRLADNTQVKAGASAPTLELGRLREQLDASLLAVVNDNGLIDSQSSDFNGMALNLERIPSALRQEARNRGVVSQIEGLDDGMKPQIQALAWMPDRSFSLQGQGHYLYARKALPPDLVRNALDVQNAYREYQERSLGREGLRRMYIGTLTLTMVLAVFGALLLVAVLSRQMAQPLLLLAEGVGEVARGDLSPKPIFESKDELGGLTRDFADMTRQLASARQRADLSTHQLDSARAHLQAILDNLNAGVIEFDVQGRLETVNPGATRILRVPLSAWRGHPLHAVPGLGELATAIEQRFVAYQRDPEPGERQNWQESFERPSPRALEPEGAQTLLVRGAELPDGGRLIVFDDITELVSAQRSKAWSEVARRVAHEIKNPLTPIQLSAERMQMRLLDKLDEPGQALLNRSVNTIVTQVHTLKTLIDEFRDFARMPMAQLVPLDLNEVVLDVCGLYADEQDRGELLVNLTEPLPQIEGDASLLRQVILNLIKNGLEAAAMREPAGAGRCKVAIATQVRRDEAGRPVAVKLRVRDDGPGFTDNGLKRAFEPYVTTKAQGTGLGLAVVKKIADEHQAVIRLGNLSGMGESEGEKALKGAQVSLSFSKLIFAPSTERA